MDLFGELFSNREYEMLSQAYNKDFAMHEKSYDFTKIERLMQSINTSIAFLDLTKLPLNFRPAIEQLADDLKEIYLYTINDLKIKIKIDEIPNIVKISTEISIFRLICELLELSQEFLEIGYFEKNIKNKILIKKILNKLFANLKLIFEKLQKNSIKIFKYM